jgi:uncharacterized protein YjbI with pentapeptide repeats
MANEISETNMAEQADEQVGQSRLSKGTSLRDRTAWEWLQLLIVPIILSLITLAFTWQQNRHQQVLETQRAQSDQRVQEQRAEDGALQAYLDKMGELMLQRNLLKSEEGDTAFTLAQARTTTVIQRFDAKHNKSVARFLTDAGLTGAGDAGPSLLAGTDLQGAELADTPLQGANFVEQQQGGSGQIHIIADPGDYVTAPGADVTVATILSDADLSRAGLQGANLSGSQLDDTILRNAALQDANLSNAILQGADLRGATLFGADFSGADLSKANLKDARGISHQTIALQGPSLLTGATMPNGKKYEDWVNDPWEYDTEQFQPAFRFEVASSEWQFTSPDTTDALSVQGPEGGQLTFTNPLWIFDSNKLSKALKVPESVNAPDWASGLQRYPGIHTSNVDRRTVGDKSGWQIDVTDTSAPEKYPQDVCGDEPCIPLYAGARESTIVSVHDNWKYRFIFLDVGGETVVINVAAPADKFDEFLPKAREVLGTVEWQE